MSGWVSAGTLRWTGTISRTTICRQLIGWCIPRWYFGLSVNERKEFIGRALVNQAILHAQVVIQFRLFECSNAGIQNIGQPGALFGNGQGGTITEPIEMSGMNVGKGGSQAIPHFAIPWCITGIGLTTKPLGLIGICKTKKNQARRPKTKNAIHAFW